MLNLVKPSRLSPCPGGISQLGYREPPTGSASFATQCANGCNLQRIEAVWLDLPETSSSGHAYGKISDVYVLGVEW